MECKREKRPLRGLSYGVNHCCIKSNLPFHMDIRHADGVFGVNQLALLDDDAMFY